MRVRSFEEARAVALLWAEEQGFLASGTPHVLDSGQEDDWYFRVVVGPAEWLADRDPLFAPTEEHVVLVSKETGSVAVYGFAESEPFLALMRPAGAGEITDEAGAAEAKRRARARVEARVARRRRFKGK